MKTLSFEYDQAFNRNLGWLTSEEQAKLKRSTVAIAGLGGVGGYQAEVLVRLGVGRFKIGDPDTFEVTNFNRQSGAAIQTLGLSKTEVIHKKILSVNPDARVEIFPDGFNAQNGDSFLEGVDFAIDGIDFFAVDAKILLFETCYQKRIPVLTSCPLGFGASLLLFSPRGMKYTQYFDLKPGMSEDQKRLALTFGLSPTPLCLPYMSGTAIDAKAGRAASVVPGLMLAGAMSGTEAVKVLTGKAHVHYCPYVFQIDLLTGEVRKKYFPLGMASPWQRLRRWFFSRRLKI